MSSLFIDIGNSRIKTRCYKDGNWAGVKHWDPEKLSELSGEVKSASQIYICAVSRKNFDRLSALLKRDYILLDHHKLSHFIRYETPDTLGVDRVLSAVGGWYITGKATIVIDAGTAVTIDEITEDGFFNGGVIMPGIAVMEQSLYKNTDLPLVERRIPEQWPPKSTRNALCWGLTGSYLAAINAHINKYREGRPDKPIVITGGDGPWLANLMEEKIELEPDLIFIGMKYIADQLNDLQ